MCKQTIATEKELAPYSVSVQILHGIVRRFVRRFGHVRTAPNGMKNWISIWFACKLCMKSFADSYTGRRPLRQHTIATTHKY
jgi:hypothetical protein